ncbi:Oidioi.mRNA.OKI2018_I69.chr2.g5657.t1.cds [Oikopleura dioica]|uniref:Ubiquitin carboxyl-terminal hydrolase 30 n=1 Tax=Oikopleura dioica TaxID=34765 RepID=A0ABN7T6Y3_OIKDI|nr:Oidioi.mRNA.OKI2018_I69.chr2.g5657.t1.cds [Oikopleura dioica]
MEAITKYASENKLEFLLLSTASAILLQQLIENRDYFLGYDQFSSKQIVSGLTNYSQLCYANSMLQLISTMPEYYNYFKQLREKYISPENNQKSAKNAKVLQTIIETIERINRICPAGSFFDASTKLIGLLASDSKWATSQQDCLELWTRMESAIELECHRSISNFGFLSYKSSKTADPFKWPTHFSTLREMVCSVCGKRKDSRVEKLHMLTLEQKYSANSLERTDLETSLEHYFKPETLIVNCEGCSTTSDHESGGQSSVMPSFDSSPEISLQDSLHKKSLSFASLPKYLCIQVTALWDPVSGNSFRNLRPWRYPDCLDLSKYCFLQQFESQKSNFNSKIYHLEAVIVHVGFDNCGHYYTLRKIDNAWYMCNDALIQRVLTGLNHNGAYILLYTR